MANLITAQEVVELAFAENSNMREESISDTSIRIAEIKYIKPVFGNMYSMLGTTYEDFTNEYIKPALAYFVKCEIVSSIAIDMSNSGIAVANPQYQSAASDKQRQRLYDSEMSKAKVLLDDALAYISTHAEDFPDFVGTAPKRHSRTGGLILGGGVPSRNTSLSGDAVSRKEFEALSGRVNELGKNASHTTYAELKALRDAGELIPGMLYRITDFVTITTQPNTQSAGHQFDIVVTALDERTLSEEAMAMMHEGDTYFAKSDIAAWRVWYSLDADSKYSWVTGANHKGVIYRLVDEYNNDLPYDFKNIQFYYDNTWYYTFDSGSLDASVTTSVVIGNRIARNDFLLQPLVFADVSKDNTIVGNDIRGIWLSFVCYGRTNDNIIIFTSACNVVAKAEFSGNQLNLDKDLITNDSFTKNRAVYLYTALTANAKVFACQFDVQQRNSVPLVLTAGRLQDCQFFGTGTFTIANASGATTGTMSFSTINLGMNGSNVKLLWNTTASLNSRIEGVTLKAYNWGTSEVVVDITKHPVNATYPLTIAKNKAGEVKVFCEADLA